MSTKYPQGLITPTPPFKSTTAKSFSGVWTLEQLAKNFYYYTQAVPKSLRFRSSASAYLSRTPASTGNRQTMTFSMWVKRGELNSSGYGYLIDGGAWTSGGEAPIMFYNDTIQIENYNGSSNVFTLITTQVFRDPSAWYHIVVAVDTTQATDSNRIKLYVNGVQVTSFSTASYPSQNLNTGWNTTATSAIGRWQGGASRYFDGYLAEVNFIDGQALDPSYFGQVSPITGVWSPAKYVGSYGTNGFYLKFSDTTSTTTLCYDYSGNGNNWTPNNISLTSGSTYDSMLDSPTNYDNGGTGVGNYAVLNPLDKGTVTVANGNLQVIFASANTNYVRGSIGAITGKWYFEVTVTGGASASSYLGIATSLAPITGIFSSNQYQWGYAYTGIKGNNGSSSAYGSSYTFGDVIGVAYDLDNLTLTFYKNNVSQGVAYSGLPSGQIYFPAVATNEATLDANFGQRPFVYTPPTGYKALNTQNLPAASIVNGASFMAATTYTGNGSTQSIVNANNGVSFQPDFVWIKDRSGTYNHRLVDSVRGVGGPVLYSNLTNAEGTDTAGVTSLNSNGFAVGIDAGYNKSSDAYVGWQWKANGTAVSNTAGSISSQVSANTTAGFSVVTYTGNGNVSATVGHGLGVAPAMVIEKGRSDGTYSWRVYHQSLSAGNMLLLNSTSGALAINSDGGISSVGSSTFGFSGGTPAVNANGATYVAYCFAAIPGYSAFGSYTGNGSSDGPFVFLGFRPRFVLIKCSSTTDQWIIHDTARDPYNISNYMLFPNLSDGGYTYDGTNTSYPFDMLSNGFKLRNAYPNSSGGTYVYACFAENPFKYSLAR